MKQLTVNCLKHLNAGVHVKDISLALSQLSKNKLEYNPWQEFNYKPDVQFTIAAANDALFLKYYVTEKEIRAVNNKINAPVYEDSCVEFFIHFNDEKGYYNFEFNCIGTALVGFGKAKTNREALSDHEIKKIKSVSVITTNEDTVSWELAINIPFSIFKYHTLSELSGKECRANFYKCGDKLSIPHFLSWTNIQSPQPNFHLPEFFGKLVFE